MASSEGLEPPTVRLEGACSVQLSYEDNVLLHLTKFKTQVQESKPLSFLLWPWVFFTFHSDFTLVQCNQSVRR